MRILIIGGMHGNEPLGIKLVEKLSNQPIKGVDGVIANKDAVLSQVRFINNDLNRSFGSGDSTEAIRAKELLKKCESYDVVLDFHNTYCPDNNCSFLGEDAKATLYQVSSTLGLKRVIVADYDCINKFAPNCLSIEISMDSTENDIEIWYEKIRKLQGMKRLTPEEGVEKYRFVYRMTLEDQKIFALDKAGLRSFKPMNKRLSDALGVSSPAYPIFIGDAFTPYNYGGVLNRLA